jgi:hypothetical protein
VDKVVGLHEAVAELVNDGDSVALEGFTHLIPFAAAHEITRQGRRRLTLIGMGCAGKLVFSWGGNPGVGSPCTASVTPWREAGRAPWRLRSLLMLLFQVRGEGAGRANK